MKEGTTWYVGPVKITALDNAANLAEEYAAEKRKVSRKYKNVPCVGDDMYSGEFYHFDPCEMRSSYSSDYYREELCCTNFPSLKELKEFAAEVAEGIYKEFLASLEREVTGTTSAKPSCFKIETETIFVETDLRCSTNRRYAYGKTYEGDSERMHEWIDVNVFSMELDFMKLSEEEKRKFLKKKAEVKILARKLKLLKPKKLEAMKANERKKESEEKFKRAADEVAKRMADLKEAEEALNRARLVLVKDSEELGDKIPALREFAESLLLTTEEKDESLFWAKWKTTNRKEAVYA